jgi:hypothetical protein
MQVGAGYRAAEASNAGGADGSGAPKGEKDGNYKRGRYTEDVHEALGGLL